MKSRAAMLLKKFNEELDPTVDQGSTDQAVVDAPGDTSATDDQPHDDNPDSDNLQDLSQPDQMADALDSAGDMCDRYMDEADTDCYTPQTDDEKNGVMEARGMMRRAGQIMRGLKR